MKDLASVSQTMAHTRFSPICPLTGSEMHPGLTVPIDWRRPADRRAWQIWWNETDGFGQVFPRPRPSDVASFYDIDAYYTHAERYTPDVADEARRVGTLGRQLGRLAWRFERGAEPTSAWWRSIIPQEAETGLEIGCGDGDRMRTFGPHLKSVRGVEPDPRAVAVARSRGLDVREGTAESLPAAIRSSLYDLIVFSHVLEHTLDPVLALANARDLLSDNGVMSVEVPNMASEGARRMGPRWRWLDVPRHLNFFTPDSLKACAEAAGLRVRAVLYRGYVRQFMPDWLIDEARITAEMEGRDLLQADIDRQVRHSLGLFAATALADPAKKYDSVRVICTRD
ncbi:class I SAM-dependent methyltransferase [Pararhodobacter zhoushanensis]|uniref:Class I SAM-dependent methyltransferase n=1 Tax=Pararhodobacter zhoushanensis TaxID=2479545 RepID=A0ABT3GX11_9RHOB|nr:class I SAM-dependent methyltransferase [Pararhodobacter zhoushanensis]MCW1932088.1 class I SAM-dependent methyltransferase [Pararhodobacter zhoushanensis]